jgi:hypothetical protein
MIAELIQNDPDLKTMAEYRSRSDGNQWKEAIQAEIASLSKGRYSLKQYLDLQKFFL